MYIQKPTSSGSIDLEVKFMLKSANSPNNIEEHLENDVVYSNCAFKGFRNVRGDVGGWSMEYLPSHLLHPILQTKWALILHSQLLHMLRDPGFHNCIGFRQFELYLLFYIQYYLYIILYQILSNIKYYLISNIIFILSYIQYYL